MATQFSGAQAGPSYPFSIGLEESFDFPGSLEMFSSNWYVPFVFALLLYLPALYIGQMIMQKREPFNLRLPMMLWNSGLAIFSIIGFLRVFPEMVHSLNRFGFHHSICNNSYIHVKPARYWIYLFVLSKIPELGDTIFLVLRKQKLIFLHVYHHASVLIFSWFVYANLMASARWFCTMNFGVHSIMYTYYVLKAVPNIIKIPKWVSMVITASQTIQMIVGAYVVFRSFFAKLSGYDCATTTAMSVFGLVIYISYLYLFSQFFYNAYCSPQSKTPRKAIVAEKKRA